MRSLPHTSRRRPLLPIEAAALLSAKRSLADAHEIAREIEQRALHNRDAEIRAAAMRGAKLTDIAALMGLKPRSVLKAIQRLEANPIDSAELLGKSFRSWRTT